MSHPSQSAGGSRVIRVLLRLFPLWALAVAALACVTPTAFTWPSAHLAGLLGLVMFGMGLTLTPADFARVLARPAPILAGVALHYLVMPAAAWLVAHLLHMPAELTAGMVLVGSVASGTASNVIIFLARGDVALSVTISALSTLVGVVATPLLTRLYVDASIAVDVAGMLISLVQIVLAPVIGGVVVHTLLGERLNRVVDVLPLVSVLAILLLIGAVVAGSRDSLLAAGPLALVGVIMHNSLGLAGGYWSARLLRFDEATCRTIAIEVGMQNSGLAAALGKLYFGPLAALPGAIFSVWHNLSGSLLASRWAARPPRNNALAARR
ncbi:ketopantoate/pantoate/pantothenate transporter PanS [Chitinasiproducens palmae]|uniref:Bile acid:Na+ symporter, BASS family n=1 Tax=Chitinasiproducens palmae TaxID=1770053 RepID=A0A1H2PL04_9BURK|nr:bile acid:sodium symporter family protein [Chitinasiproducens palmae]SDV46293.1 bile acid:Na+ symporter, BASS family [Chitinasiproducens palmae]